ncbi:hypothetical protein [Streptomyces sp. A1136]|uniref:hypothetical protein n=1 Tax=Streptomyces sp. A1136 TaxID=2563102 RepID=UPI00109E917C|nr:hypothetical protein [Streptomyces sp. A1136]THA53148.1 hypothetical protein E6R62_18800 [Streptomyces sp. A1136]
MLQIRYASERNGRSAGGATRSTTGSAVSHRRDRRFHHRPAAERGPDTGVITCHTTAHDQDDTAVLAFARTFLVPLDADAARDATNY